MFCKSSIEMEVLNILVKEIRGSDVFAEHLLLLGDTPVEQLFYKEFRDDYFYGKYGIEGVVAHLFVTSKNCEIAYMEFQLNYVAFTFSAAHGFHITSGDSVPRVYYRFVKTGDFTERETLVARFDMWAKSMNDTVSVSNIGEFRESDVCKNATMAVQSENIAAFSRFGIEKIDVLCYERGIRLSDISDLNGLDWGNCEINFLSHWKIDNLTYYLDYLTLLSTQHKINIVFDKQIKLDFDSQQWFNLEDAMEKFLDCVGQRGNRFVYKHDGIVEYLCRSKDIRNSSLMCFTDRKNK